MTTISTDHPGLPLRSGSWALDHQHTTVGFTIRHLGVAKVRGRFQRFDAEVVVGDTLDGCSVAATVDLSSVDTGVPDRDDHIRAADMIDVATRPTMTFRSQALTANGDGWHLAGDLTIGDVTKPLTLDLELGGLADFPVDGTRHAGLSARGQIRRSDYGIAPGMPSAVLGDVVGIELDLELVEPARE